MYCSAIIIWKFSTVFIFLIEYKTDVDDTGSSWRQLLQPDVLKPFRLLLMYFFFANLLSMVPYIPYLVEVFLKFGTGVNPEWTIVSRSQEYSKQCWIHFYSHGVDFFIFVASVLEVKHIKWEQSPPWGISEFNSIQLLISTIYYYHIHNFLGILDGLTYNRRHADCILDEQTRQTVSYLVDVAYLFYLPHINRTDWRLLYKLRTHNVMDHTNTLPCQLFHGFVRDKCYWMDTLVRNIPCEVSNILF